MVVSKVSLSEYHRPDFKVQTFSELIGALFTAFTDMGIEVSYRQNQIDKTTTNIIFGCHRLVQSFKDVGVLPGNCIVFNLEPLNPESENPSHLKYLDLLKQSRVIDYSDRNCRLLAKEGNDKVYRFKFGYTSLTPYKFPSKGNHLLFYGEPTDRRKSIIENVLNQKIPLFGIVDYWGFERDYEIATSRAVLNISKRDNTILEVYRLWHSLCLGTSVISEKGLDTVLVDEWKEYVGFIDNPYQISSDTVNLAPSPEYFRMQTSFHSESVKLRNWIHGL